VLGIVIGIGSVIIMVAIGKAAQTSIEQNIQAMGSNLLMVRPGVQRSPGSEVRGASGSAQSLTLSDVESVKKELENIQAVAPEVSVGRKQITALGKNTNTSVTGVTEEYASVRNITVASGSFITADQERSLAKVAFVGPDVAVELFGENSNVVGKKIRIGTVDFSVIGIATVRGSTGFGSSDDFVLIPLSTSQQFFVGDKYLSSLNIKMKSNVDMTASALALTDVLRTAHKLDKKEEADFNVRNQADIVSTASSVTSTFTTLLGAVASISLLVGGIGIMNMMLTTVTERTREIGLRKAIGAKRRDIQIQFLCESIFLTFLGGGLGILLGFIAISLLNTFGIGATLSLSSVFVAFIVSTVIGILFGYYPAARAARMNPIEALRYE